MLVKHLEECLTYSKHQISAKCYYCAINNNPLAHEYSSEVRYVFVTEVGTVGLEIHSYVICWMSVRSRLLSGPVVSA